MKTKPLPRRGPVDQQWQRFSPTTAMLFSVAEPLMSGMENADDLARAIRNAAWLLEATNNVLRQSGTDPPPRDVEGLARLAARLLAPGADCFKDPEGLVPAFAKAQEIWAIGTVGQAVSQGWTAKAVPHYQFSNPPQWPGTLNDFYRLVMRDPHAVNCQRRFKAYLYHEFESAAPRLSQTQLEDAAQKEFERIKREGLNPYLWFHFGVGYTAWQWFRTRLARSEAGKKGRHSQLQGSKTPAVKHPA